MEQNRGLHTVGCLSEGSPLNNICNNLGIDITDDIKMQRVKTIATCLKDADALDRTRFFSKTRSFTNPDMLHHSISKKLIKIGTQINECYAIIDIQKICDNKPELKPIIENDLVKYKCPKYTISAIRHGSIKIKQEKVNVSEEENNYGQTTRKK